MTRQGGFGHRYFVLLLVILPGRCAFQHGHGFGQHVRHEGVVLMATIFRRVFPFQILRLVVALRIHSPRFRRIDISNLFLLHATNHPFAGRLVISV